MSTVLKLNPRVPKPPDSVFQARHGSSPRMGEGSPSKSSRASSRARSVPPPLSATRSSSTSRSAAADDRVALKVRPVSSITPVHSRLMLSNAKPPREGMTKAPDLAPKQGTPSNRIKKAPKPLKASVIRADMTPRTSSKGTPSSQVVDEDRPFKVTPRKSEGDKGKSSSATVSVPMPLPLSMLQGTAAAAGEKKATSRGSSKATTPRLATRERASTPHGQISAPSPCARKVPGGESSAGSGHKPKSPRMSLGRPSVKGTLAPPPPPPPAVRLIQKKTTSTLVQPKPAPKRVTKTTPRSDPKVIISRTSLPSPTKPKESELRTPRRLSQIPLSPSTTEPKKTSVRATSLAPRSPSSVIQVRLPGHGSPPKQPLKRRKAETGTESPASVHTPASQSPVKSRKHRSPQGPSPLRTNDAKGLSPIPISPAPSPKTKAAKPPIVPAMDGIVTVPLIEDSAADMVPMEICNGDLGRDGRRHASMEVYDIGARLSDAMPLVVDNGTYSLKAGAAQLQAPSCVFATVVGRPKKQRAILESSASLESFVGDVAQQRRGVLSLTWPIKEGVITSWEDMEVIWNHLFQNELLADPSEHPILLTDIPLSDKRTRLKMAEYMFETFQVPAIYISNTANLTVMAAGTTTGLSVSSGHGVSHVVPVYEGHTLNHGVCKAAVAGHHLAEYMGRLLRDSQLPCNVNGLDMMALKAGVCYVAKNFQKEMRRPKSGLVMEYSLPDGNTVEIGDARFRCPEALFRPELLGLSGPSLQAGVMTAVNCCDPDLHTVLYSQVVLSGGNTLYPGTEKRLLNEVEVLAENYNINMVAKSERLYFPWIGGAMLASSSPMVNNWVVDDEYKEFGPDIVPRKCI